MPPFVFILLLTSSYCISTLQLWSNYSSVYCKRRRTQLSRLCHFKNICWDRYNLRFVFYHLSGLTAPFDSEQRYKLPSDLVSTRRGYKMDNNTKYMNITQVHSSIDFSHSVVVKNFKVAVYFESFWAENFGHALIDDILGSYSLLHFFNMYSRKAQLMTPKDKCETIVSTSKRNRGERLLTELNELISVNPIIEMSKHDQFNLISDPKSSVRFTCIPNVLVGHAEIGLFHDKSYAWRSFKKSVFKHLKAKDKKIHDTLSTIKKRKKHLIVVIIKNGRRSVLNTNYLVTNMQRMFDVDIVAIEPNTLPLYQQIDLALRATIIITPTGGISFFAAFAAAQCAVIFFGQWSKIWNRGITADSFFWEYVDDILDYYYNPEFKEVTILPPGNTTHPEDIDYRNFGSMTVNCSRFVKLVAEVLTISNNIHEIHAGEHFPFKHAQISERWDYACTN